MAQAFFWGALGSAFLLIGGWMAYRFDLSRRFTAIVMALGSGVLFGSVAYELVAEALKTRSVLWVGLALLVGAVTFAVGDWLINRAGGSER